MSKILVLRKPLSPFLRSLSNRGFRCAGRSCKLPLASKSERVQEKLNRHGNAIRDAVSGARAGPANFRWPRNLNAYKKNAIDMATPYANARMATTAPTLLFVGSGKYRGWTGPTTLAINDEDDDRGGQGC